MIQQKEMDRLTMVQESNRWGKSNNNNWGKSNADSGFQESGGGGSVARGKCFYLRI